MPRKQTFLQGALILIAANACVKIIGAIFKIPLDNLIGADGMGLFTVAYNLYSAMFVLSTAGLPVAVSRMVAHSNALGRVKEVRKILRVSFAVFVGVGAVCSVGMFLGAGAFVRSIPNTRALYAVLAVSPAIFFVSLMSVFRGYYQGLSDMVPTAVSQVIEAICKLLLGYGFAFLALRAGYGVEIAAAGAILGISIGSVLGSIYLIWRFKHYKLDTTNGTNLCQSASSLLKCLVSIAIPITLSSAILSITNFIDMYVVLGRLQDIGFREELANMLYGTYSVKAVSLMSMPQTLITALAVSLIPAISASFAKRNISKASEITESALRITLLIALPCAFGIGVMSDNILSFLFHNADEVSIAAPLLRLLSPSVVFVALVTVTNAILQAVGMEKIAVLSMLAGGAVKLIVNYTLIGIEDINISGAPIGTTACYFAITLINIIILISKTNVAPKNWRSFAKPLIAAALMGLIAFALRGYLTNIFGNTLVLFTVILVSVFVYLALLIVFGAIHKEDMMMLPKGEKIVKILRLR